MITFKAQNKPKIAFLLDGRIEITFITNKQKTGVFEELEDKELIVQVKEDRPTRSKSQNSYMWVLINEIAKKVGITKEEAYRTFVKDYGVFEILPIKNEAVDSFIYKWSKNGIGWFCEDLGESKLSGYTKLIAYFGTSSYNSQEMARVLEAIVNMCKDLGIDTMTPQEMALLTNENEKEKKL